MRLSRNLITLTMASALISALLLDVAASFGQQAAPKTTKKTTAKKAAPKRPPLTQAEVLKLWNAGDQEVFLNELRLRGLAFEPEEDWVAQFKSVGNMPLAIDALRKLIPPAPSVDAVTAQAPDLLSKVRDAAQKRSESGLAPLVHPDLLASKAKVYDLFDITNYKNHSLGRIAPMENGRVGVQFFELTTAQVERLYYLAFTASSGRIVLRDVITGQNVDALFLRDERQLALSKLELMFRALNDGDDSGLKNLCTPGLFDSLKAKTGDDGGSLLTRGQHVPLARINTDASISQNEKSVRVVVKVGYPTNGKPLQYYVDFERIDKDLKVVRVRDLKGGVIAWDPNIDNYLNRRYGLPDGPPPQNVAESDDPMFIPTKMLRAQAMRALTSGDPDKLKPVADEMLARDPKSGEGYGMRASAEYLKSDHDNATNDAQRALDRGGTVFFDVLQYNNAMGMSRTFTPVILGVSNTKVEMRPPMGGQSEEIPATSVKAAFEKPSWKDRLNPFNASGPFLKLDVVRQKNKSYRIAAIGTTCPDAASVKDKNLEQYPGGTCGSTGTSPNAQMVNMLVPHEWFQDLKIVADTLDYAHQAGAAAAKK